MGNKLSKENMQLRQLMSRFDELQRIPERNITFLQDKETHKEFVLKEATFNDQKEFNRNVQKLLSKKAALEGQSHVVQLSEYLVRTEDQYCSTFYKIYALFEYPYKTLEDEIHERQLQHRRFLEKQLWSILASCILGLSHLQKFDIRHQALKSSSILLTNDGLIKVADPYCVSQPTNYEQLLTKRNTPHIYLSPELCEALSQELTSPQLLNVYRSDVFTVAMIMLEAGLLQYQDECYRDECSRVHWDTLQYNLDRFGEGYSNQLKSTLESMLQQAQEDRPEWTDLEAHVKIGEESEVDPTQTPKTKQREQTRPSHRGQSNISMLAQHNIAKSTVSNAGAAVPSVSMEVSPQSVATTVVQQQVQQTASQVHPREVTISQQPAAAQRSSSQQPTNQIYMAQTQPGHQQVVGYHPTSSYNPPGQVAASQLPQQPLVNPIPTMKKTQAPVPISPSIITHDELYPVKTSLLERPVFSTINLPNPTYITHVKNDQNLVQVYEASQEEEQNSLQVQQATRQNEFKLHSPTVGLPVSQQAANQGTIINMGKSGNAQLTSGLTSIQSPAQQAPSIGTSLSSLNSNQLYTPNQQPVRWQPGTAALTGLNSYNNSNPAGGYTSSAGLTSYQPTSFATPGLIPPFSSAIPSSNNFTSSSAATFSNSYSQFYSPSINFTSTTPATHTPSYLSGQYYPPAPDLPTGLSKTANFGFNNGPPSATFPSDRSSKPSKDFEAELSKPARTFVIEIFKQGSKYEGEKLNDMRDGHGKFYYQDGGLYDGEWRQNKMSGRGKLFYQSGKIAYDGEWSNDQFTGFGVLYNEQPVMLNKAFEYTNLDEIDEYWTRFEGDFFDDLKHGMGKLYLSNDQWFEGQFDKDVASGPGRFHTIRGQTVEGIWSNNQLQRRTN